MGFKIIYKKGHTKLSSFIGKAYPTILVGKKQNNE